MKPEKDAGEPPAVQPTIEVGGRQVRVRKWPIRRAFCMMQRAMQACAPVLAKVDLEKLSDAGALADDLAAQLSGENAALAVEMIDWALDMPPGDDRMALAEGAGIEDLVTVLDRNLVFPLGRLAQWWRSSKTSTTPAPASPDSGSPSSQP